MVVGLALVLELLSKHGASPLQISAVHSYAFLSAESAATAAAASGLGLLAFTSGLLYRDPLQQTAHCEEYRNPSYTDIDREEDQEFTTYSADGVPVKLPQKSYVVTLKPLFSAFAPKALAATVVRALLVNFQPALEAYVSTLNPDDDDEDEAPPTREPINYNAAFVGSGKTILQEVAVVTTRRVLERVVVQHASKRTAWKLLKDLRKSSERKAGRHLSKLELFVGVKKTTFRGHALTVAASWLVQLVIDMYRCSRNIHHRMRKLADNAGNKCQNDLAIVLREEYAFLGRRVVGNTLKCGASLVCASLGAGLGAVIISPSTGQWLGCIAGEYGGSILMSLWLDPWVVHGTFNFPEAD